MHKISVENIRRSLRRLNQSYGLYDDKTWDAFGISYALSQVLFALTETDRPIAKNLVELLQIEKSTLSRFLTQLHKKKLISYTVSPEDARAKQIALTEKGKNVLDRLNQYGDGITTRALQGLNSKEVINIERSLAKLEENLRGKRYL